MTVLHRPEPPTHTCAPPIRDHMVRPPHGPALTPSIDERDRLATRGCRHWLDGADRQPWGEACPVHPVPGAAKVGTMAAEPVGTLWRCDDCGTVWIVRSQRDIDSRSAWTAPRTGGYRAGGPPQWARATWWERRVLPRRGRRR